MSLNLDDLASFASEAFYKEPSTTTEPVQFSRELERILAIPRREVIESDKQVIDRIVRHPWATMDLFPVQVDALWEVMHHRGLFGPIAVGGGKTLIAALVPTILGISDAVVLTTSGLVKEAKRELTKYSKSFKIDNRVKWISYGILSNAEHCLVLDRLKPKLIIADECHMLANPTAARTKRFLRHFRNHPDTVFVGLTGTSAKSSLKDFAHLMQLALKDRTPLPRSYPTLKEWSEAVDVSKNLRPPGALLRLCTTEELEAVEQARLQATEAARSGIRRRIVQTEGVVASTRNEVRGVGLVIRSVRVSPSEWITKAHNKLLSTWCRPDGEELQYALELDRVSKQMRLGGFYQWVWPGGIKDEEWIKARSEYRKEMRAFLADSSGPGLDSPALVERAIGRGEVKFLHWDAWARVKHRPEPPVEWTWISDRVIKWAAGWIQQHPQNSIVWTTVTTFAQTLAQAAGIPYYGAGPEDARAIMLEDGRTSMVCSVSAHGIGRNLQHGFHTNLVLAGLSSGDRYEQLIGRTHRPGQNEQEVVVEVADIYLDEFKKATYKAAFIQQTLGNEQKLLSVRFGSDV